MAAASAQLAQLFREDIARADAVRHPLDHGLDFRPGVPQLPPRLLHVPGGVLRLAGQIGGCRGDAGGALAGLDRQPGFRFHMLADAAGSLGECRGSPDVLPGGILDLVQGEADVLPELVDHRQHVVDFPVEAGVDAGFPGQVAGAEMGQVGGHLAHGVHAPAFLVEIVDQDHQGHHVLDDGTDQVVGEKGGVAHQQGHTQPVHHAHAQEQ
jgi:hypothetical protein